MKSVCETSTLALIMSDPLFSVVTPPLLSTAPWLDRNLLQKPATYNTILRDDGLFL